MNYARVSLLMLSMILVLSACSSGGKPQEPKMLTVTPLSGPPGTILTVTGLQLTPEQLDNLELWVGDQPGPVTLNEDGSLSTAVPLFLGPDNWPQPPAEPQTVEVRHSGLVLGTSAEGVTVTDLPRAPGTTQEVQVALAEIATAYENLLSMIPAASEEEAVVREAVMAMFKGLVSEGEDSLQAVLDGTAPILEGAAVDTELIDAVLASSGAAAYLREYANAFGSATAQVQLSTQAIGGLCDGEGEDIELACKMQIYVVLDEYTRTVVKPTVETYNNTVGLAFGVVGISGIKFGPQVIISALMSVTEFVMSKIVPALLPAKLSQFELQVSKTTIKVGEVTTSTLIVAAVNSPPPMGLSDYIKLTMATLGLQDAKTKLELKPFEEMLKKAALFALKLYLKVIQKKDSDATLAQMPLMQWGPVEVTNPRLIDLFSYDTSIVAPLEEEAEWKGVGLGEATVRVMPRGPGSKSKVLRDRALCPWCIYYGGAFGTEMPSAQQKIIVGEITLTATPDTGKAPLAVTFSWTGLEPQEEPYACILEVGDGSTMYSIPDCANTTSQTHTYPYTSVLDTESGKYLTTLKVVGAEKSAATEVLVDWVFTATPTQGQAPLDVTFTWSGFDPGGGAISCTLDFGDGSPTKTFNDCHSTKTATHRYSSKGSYVPSLTVKGASGETVKTAQVTVMEESSCSNPTLLDLEGATGTATLFYEGYGETTEPGYFWSVSVKRSANVTFSLTKSDEAYSYIYWRAEVTGGSASIRDVQLWNGHTMSIEGSGAPRPTHSVGTIVTNMESCTISSFHLTIGVDSDSYGGYSQVGHIALKDVSLSGSKTVRASHFATSADSLGLDGTGTYTQGYALDLARIVGVDNLGTGDVSWSITPRR